MADSELKVLLVLIKFSRNLTFKKYFDYYQTAIAKPGLFSYLKFKGNYCLNKINLFKLLSYTY